MESKQEQLDQMGGRASLEKINKIFYDKVYAHPWLKLYFEDIPQQHIENQQTNFMQKALGGDNIYAGKAPPPAHTHMFITDELFEVRRKVLQQAFIEANASPKLIQKWLALDDAFQKSLVKMSIEECKGRYNSDPILNFPNPEANN